VEIIYHSRQLGLFFNHLLKYPSPLNRRNRLRVSILLWRQIMNRSTARPQSPQVLRLLIWVLILRRILARRIYLQLGMLHLRVHQEILYSNVLLYLKWVFMRNFRMSSLMKMCTLTPYHRQLWLLEGASQEVQMSSSVRDWVIKKTWVIIRDITRGLQVWCIVSLRRPMKEMLC